MLDAAFSNWKLRDQLLSVKSKLHDHLIVHCLTHYDFWVLFRCNFLHKIQQSYGAGFDTHGCQYYGDRSAACACCSNSFICLQAPCCLELDLLYMFAIHCSYASVLIVLKTDVGTFAEVETDRII